MKDGKMIRNAVFGENGLYAENENILLRDILPSDIDPFLDMFRAKDEWKMLMEYPELHTEDNLWNGLFKENDLNVMIIRKKDGLFCGYCSLQNFTEDEEPELSIDLTKDAQHQGIGTQTLLLLMQHYSQITGTKQYIAKVSAGNAASQKLMRRIGGKAAGVVPMPGISDKIAKMMEDNDAISFENETELAEEFGTSSRKLRSHALLFRFFV